MFVLLLKPAWLSGSERDSAIRGTLCPDGYKVLDVPQANCRLGGVALICKQSLIIKQQKVTSASSYGCMKVLITAENEVGRLSVGLPTIRSNQPVSIFIDEFYSYIDK